MDDESEMEVENIDELLQDAADFLEEGDFEEAVATLRAAAERFPESPLPLHDLGAAYLTWIRAGLERPTIWENLSDDEQAYLDATDAFTQALEIEPDFVPSLNNLAALKAMRDQYMEAVQLWERSLAVNPGQADVIEDLDSVRKRLQLENEEV